MGRFVAFALLLAACGTADEEALPPTERAAPQTPVPAGAATISVEGEARPVGSAFAWRHDGAVRLLASTAERTCGDVQARSRSREDDEVIFDLRLLENLTPDGRLFWRVSSFHAGGGIQFWDEREVPVEGEVAPGEPFAVTLAVGTYGDGFPDRRQRHVRLAGRVEAQGCPPVAGRERDDPGPVLERPQDATLEVAGHRLPIVGALMRGDDLVLSTAPASCDDHLNRGAPAILELGHGGHIGGQRLRSANLSGRWFDGNLIEASDRLGLSFTVRPAGEGRVRARVEGSATVRDYPVSLSGELVALDCR